MKRRLEIEDLLRYRFLSSLKASADKKQCVFNVHQANLEKNGYDSDLYLYDAQTEGDQTPDRFRVGRKRHLA